MKSYYGHCQNLKDEEFSEHLAIQQHYGIPVVHRRRPDGSSVIMMRHSQHGMYTPEKAAPVSVRSSSCESVIVGCVSGSAEPSPVECAPPPVVRPIDPQGVVGAAIPPETLLCSEEQEVIRRFRVQKRQSERGTNSSGDLFERSSRASRPLVAAYQAPTKRRIAYSPEHTPVMRPAGA